MSDFEIVKYKETNMLAVKNVKGGRVPDKLAGVFTKSHHAEVAIANYEASKPEKVDYTPESTPLIELDKLSKKAALLEFAEEQGIPVPEDMTQPSRIKKYLKDILELTDA